MPPSHSQNAVAPHSNNGTPTIGNPSQLIVLVPIYRPHLDALEQFSLDTSLSSLAGRDIRFIGPNGLELALYTERYPSIPFIGFEDASFASIEGYNRLLLNPEFYKRFAEFEFVLILQTDAIVLRDELDFWCGQPFDYVGAPWPDSVELFVNLGRFEGDKGRRLRAMVGNGGLSLRRIRKCIPLLQEFPEAIDFFNRSGSSEDLFFFFMGLLSCDFVMPNEITASLFSLELKPSYYMAVNGGKIPMGGHAWWKYEPEFWRKLLVNAPLPEVQD
jgi:hypothetical protein